MDRFAPLRREADDIISTLTTRPCWELQLRPQDIIVLEDESCDEWEILGARFGGKEILHAHASLPKAVLLIALVHDTFPIRLRLAGSNSLSLAADRIDELVASLPGDPIPQARSTPAVAALKEALGLTLSSHGRLALLQRVACAIA